MDPSNSLVEHCMKIKWGEKGMFLLSLELPLKNKCCVHRGNSSSKQELKVKKYEYLSLAILYTQIWYSMVLKFAVKSRSTAPASFKIHSQIEPEE